MSLDLATLKVGDRVVPTDPCDGDSALVVTAIGRTQFLAVTADMNENSEDAHALRYWSLVPPPPLIDPEEVWVEIRAANGHLYLVKAQDYPDSYLGRQTGRRFRMTAYEVVE